MCFFLRTSPHITFHVIHMPTVNKNEKYTEESFGSKYSRYNADYPCRFSATRRCRHILCNQRHQHPRPRRKPTLTKQHIWYDADTGTISSCYHGH